MEEKKPELPGGILRIDTGAGKFVLQEFEVYKLVPENSQVLKTPAVPFDFEAYRRDGHKYTAPENPVYLMNSLFETMFKHDGLGLAAPQVGIPYAVFVMGTQDAKQVMFNPVILQESTEREKDIEGCLSFPGLLVQVPRSKVIRVKWQHVDGSEKVQEIHGLTARIVQHEIEHLRGVPFWRLAGETSLMLARQKRAKFLKKEARK